MSKIEVNQISSQCGSTLTIGQSGDTVTLACGATQTGFGRTGTVDWCTTAKTAPFTGVSGKGYFVNTTCGAVTVTLPATPTAGDIISIADYASTFQTNNVTLCRNGSKINGVCATAIKYTRTICNFSIC
jgi:acetylornithine/succinyldiaminopimelate/putrescine aminotransferase